MTTTTDSIRETVARAVCRARKQPEEIRIVGSTPRVEPNWPRYLPDADAAIAAHLAAMEAEGLVVVPAASALRPDSGAFAVSIAASNQETGR